VVWLFEGVVVLKGRPDEIFIKTIHHGIS